MDDYFVKKELKRIKASKKNVSHPHTRGTDTFFSVCENLLPKMAKTSRKKECNPASAGINAHSFLHGTIPFSFHYSPFFANPAPTRPRLYASGIAAVAFASKNHRWFPLRPPRMCSYANVRIFFPLRLTAISVYTIACFVQRTDTQRKSSCTSSAVSQICV